MDDPRINFLKDISLDKSRITNFSGSIFFCGGPINNVNLQPISVRDCLYRYILDNDLKELSDRIILAEDIQDWFQEGTYSDLISFERDLAHLASWVVLIVESPGSIAELGAFCQVKEIYSKLLLFLRSNDYEESSFIRLGPIKYLEEKKLKDRIKKYPWEINKGGIIDTKSFDNIRLDIIEDLRLHTSLEPSSRNLKVSDPGHIMILLCDLIDICVSLKLKEIEQFLNELKIFTTPSTLKKYLFILQKFELIQRINYGDTYFIIKKPNNYIKYRTKNGSTHDRIRLKVVISQFYEKADPRRIRALKTNGARF